ncbi:hypothetical protein ACFL59_10950 [Planctomycetota bacterium]
MALLPRAVLVTRPTELEELLVRHGTRSQARFFLAGQGLDLGDVEERHALIQSAVAAVHAAIPLEWRRASVTRADLDRFLFGPEDLVVAVGQDGLVANVAKYLSGQLVIGVNPGLYEGVLVPHAPGNARELMEAAVVGEGDVEERTLVEAVTPGGQRLRALNEVFVGHRTHQSARYLIAVGDRRERQSSSGIIVTTGTGATGWARSISRERSHSVELPEPSEKELVFFVREAFPSPHTGVSLTEGSIGDRETLEITSEMNVGGTAFGDGIEDDPLDFHFGQKLIVRASPQALRLFRG